MCRFVAYLGSQPSLLSNIIINPENSLIHQSKSAKEGHFRVNGDGFGLAWYKQKMDPAPGIFKSIQPAWNDSNLMHMAGKIKSDCLLAHIRASTVGDVNFNNCHPFYYQQYAFVHNGTVHGFEKIRRQLLAKLDDDIFDAIKAQTDSEHLFFLIMQYLKQPGLTLPQAVFKAFNTILELLAKHDPTAQAKLNIAITDGDQVITTRYANQELTPLSLYYRINPSEDGDNIIIASEPLDDNIDAAWHEVPHNHFVHCKRGKSLLIKTIKLS